MSIALAIILASVLVGIGAILVGPLLINYYFEMKYKFFVKVVNDISKVAATIIKKKESEENGKQ